MRRTYVTQLVSTALYWYPKDGVEMTDSIGGRLYCVKPIDALFRPKFRQNFSVIESDPVEYLVGLKLTYLTSQVRSKFPDGSEVVFNCPGRGLLNHDRWFLLSHYAQGGQGKISGLNLWDCVYWNQQESRFSLIVGRYPAGAPLMRFENLAVIGTVFEPPLEYGVTSPIGDLSFLTEEGEVINTTPFYCPEVLSDISMPFALKSLEVEEDVDYSALEDYLDVATFTDNSQSQVERTAAGPLFGRIPMNAKDPAWQRSVIHFYGDPIQRLVTMQDALAEFHTRYVGGDNYFRLSLQGIVGEGALPRNFTLVPIMNRLG